jgi:hypothetical protein
MVDPDLLHKITLKVTPLMNDNLLAPFLAEDVKKAAFSIGDLNAPGPDGLHAIFYKRFWSLCGDEITQEALQAMETRIIPDGWNDTTVVLILKVDNPESITQYCLISLCNVIYKIISKMLAQRLKISSLMLFPQCRVLLFQVDSLLIMSEWLMSPIKNKRSNNIGACAVKLDMHKAYDRVEWVFLKKYDEMAWFCRKMDLFYDGLC